MQGYWLKRNQIGIEGCAEILAALECNSTLTTLDLVQNDLGAEVPPPPSLSTPPLSSLVNKGRYGNSREPRYSVQLLASPTALKTSI